MDRTPTKPIGIKPTRARTPSVSETMKPPSSSVAGSPARRGTATLSRATGATPKVTPTRARNRTSLLMNPLEKAQLASMLKTEPEEFSPFVTYITETLLVKSTGCSNLKDATFLKISESDSKVKYLENLDLVVNLEEVDLSDNQIAQIRNVSHLKRLRVLNLSTNLITMIEGLDTLSKLEELDLSGNQIERIPASIKSLVSLKTLKLHNNRLSTLRDLGSLRQLKNLVSLTIFQNPMSDVEHSRLFAVYQLPSLGRLDDSEIDEEERSSAQLRFDREEIETLEQQLAKYKLDLKGAKDEIEAMKKEGSTMKVSSNRMGKDAVSLVKRVESLEAESHAKTELLNKKSSELVGLCELLYEMKQELAFANIDKQFDMSAVDSILGEETDSAAGSTTNGRDDFDSQLANIDSDDFSSSNSSMNPMSGGSTPMYGRTYLSPAFQPSGTLSPALSLHTQSSIAQEFREMPYIGKSAATPNKQPPKVSVSYKPNLAATAEVQQAAYRYKTLLKEQEELDGEYKVLKAALEKERAKWEALQKSLAEKETFIKENPDSTDAFALYSEIEALKEQCAAQELIVRNMEQKMAELEERLKNNNFEAEQMRALLGDLDMDSINDSYDLSMEIKSLEAQLEDRDELIQKMQAVLAKHGLENELQTTVVLRTKESSLLPPNSHTHTDTQTLIYSSDDLLAKLKEMEDAHVMRVKGLIKEFPKFPTEEKYWDSAPQSVDEASHTLQQQIKDAFGSEFAEFDLTDGLAGLKGRILKLEAQNSILEELKFTRFFNTEDGMIDISKDEEFANIDVQSYETQFKEDEVVYKRNLEKLRSGEKLDSCEVSMPKGSGISHGVYREKMGKAVTKQIRFLWLILAKKMDTLRMIWEMGALDSSNMKDLTETGEWKYWTGMGRMEYFFRNAMAQIYELDGQLVTKRAQLSENDSFVAEKVKLLKIEQESLVNAIDTLSSELAMKQVDARVLRDEMEELEKQSVESANKKVEMTELQNELLTCKSKTSEAQNELKIVEGQVKKVQGDLRGAQTKLEAVQADLEAAQVSKSQIEKLKLESQNIQAQNKKAAQDHDTLKREHAALTQRLATMQTSKEELDHLKRENELIQEQIARSKANLAHIQQQQQTSNLGQLSVTVSGASTPSKSGMKPSTSGNSLHSIPSTPTKTSTTTGPSTPTKTSSNTAGSETGSEPALVSGRLSMYRQKEQEVRLQKEAEEIAKSNRSAPKRSWTVAESTNFHHKNPSSSSAASNTSIASGVDTTPQVVPHSSADSSASKALPKELQAFLKTTTGK